MGTFSPNTEKEEKARKGKKRQEKAKKGNKRQRKGKETLHICQFHETQRMRFTEFKIFQDTNLKGL